MARSLRQTKILELIKRKEIETQEELARELRELNFDITQATVSRDIKELGLIKTPTADGKKYKYAIVDSNKQPSTNKLVNSLMKEAIQAVIPAKNLIVIKTLRGYASSICALLDSMAFEFSLGTVFGDDTVMMICKENGDASYGADEILKLCDLNI